VADPPAELELQEALVVRPGDVLVIRVSPERIRTEAEFEEFVTRVKDAFKDRLPDSPTPVVIVADQLAVQQPQDT